MMKKIKKLVSVFTLMCILVVSANITTVNAATRAIPSVSYSVVGNTYVGNTYDISIKVNNAANLTGYSLDFKYDPTLLEVVSVTDGDMFKGLNYKTPVKTISKGNISIATVLLGNTTGVSKSSAEILRVKVKALKAGTINIRTIKDNSSLSVTGNNSRVKLTNSNGDKLDYTSTAFAINQKVETDWERHWAKTEIQYAMDKGWVQNSAKFRPEDAITRAEFVKIVNKAFGYTKMATGENFSDVEKGQWWYGEVLIAVQAGYIDSKQSKFRPEDKISREEVAVILTNIKKNKDTNIDKLNKYKDKNQVSSWALSSVEGAIEAGYMGQNITEFRPRANITRAEALVTVYRVTKK